MSRIFVLKQLKALKRKKATGLDNLPSALLKDCADAIAGLLSHHINLSLKTGTVPLIWKKARITPLHKFGSTATPENNRPISVLPILSKILEKSVHEQFYNFLKKENVISNRQFGYTKKPSTELASTILLDDTLEWFKNYLFHGTEQVEIDSRLSDEKPVFSGVPQEFILGPLLFVIFYNDLTDYITNAEVLQYADDTVLYFANSKVSLIEKALNDDLKQISTFCHDNELVLNLKKTKTEVMLCGTTIRISKSEELRLFYQGERILQSSCCKYLGTIVNPTATMSDDFDAKYK